jgi:cytochrome c peroxidase
MPIHHRAWSLGLTWLFFCSVSLAQSSSFDPFTGFSSYGPNQLYKKWSASEKIGRDTWIFWTGGNEHFYRQLAVNAGPRSSGGHLLSPISIDFYRILDTRQREHRFRKLGLINEPNTRKNDAPDEYGFWFDKVDELAKDSDYPPNLPDNKKHYGESTGVVGLRKFPNPKFDKSKWAGREKDLARAYFTAPWAIEPPYLVGLSCAFCHIAFDPTNPPSDPSEPRWNNLAANMGNQYFREGDIFLGDGRVVFGNKGPLPPEKGKPADPYHTTGLPRNSFLRQYGITQQPGTSETSRISYDFINNPNTINAIFNLGNRPLFPETAPDGTQRLVNHILKDGADSVGVDMALLRVWINIGMEGNYWLDHLFNPVSGQRQQPFDLDEIRLNVSKDRQDDLKTAYGPKFGSYWKEAERRNPHLVSYLASYSPFTYRSAYERLFQGDKMKDFDDAGLPFRLKSVGNYTKGIDPEMLQRFKAALNVDEEKAKRGAHVFAKNCAECHSSKQPYYSLGTKAQKDQFYLDSVLAPTFRSGNALTDDKRYKASDLGLNLARSLATNAIDGDVWANFSSKEYKALPPLGRVELEIPFLKGQPPIKVAFTPPGGGRGYYRTASLVSMWATAPYLHNNSVGDYVVVKDGKPTFVPNDGTPLIDPIDVSVAGRMAMFVDGMEKMLWKEKRHGWIKRTQVDCNLVEVVPNLKPTLVSLVEIFILETVEAEIRNLLTSAIAEGLIPGDQVPLVEATARKLLPAYMQRLRGKLKEADDDDDKNFRLDLGAFKQELGLILTDFDGIVQKLHAPKTASQLVMAKKLRELVAKKLDRLDDFADAKYFTIPQGTPINLYANLDVASITPAFLAHLRHRDDPRALITELLRLSRCPDLVEDKGHTFGNDLSDDDKWALIEFLKSL